MKRLLLACIWLPAAHAAENPAANDALAVWLNPGFYSYHFQRDKGFRDNNYGAGVQVQYAPSQSAIAGVYRNSEDYTSHYVGWVWQPLRVGAARVGLVALAVDGYPKMTNGGWFLAALPVVSLEWRRVGVNFTVTPTYQDKISGAFISQIKFRIW